MTIQLPKELRGFTNRRVMPADFNTLDVDLVLPALYFKIVTGGQDRARRANDPIAISKYVRKLAHHPRVGMSDPDGTDRVLDRLVRTALITVGRSGESGTKGDQIRTTDDTTLLSFKPGFPHELTAIRRVEDFIYALLTDSMTARELRELFVASLGQGLKISGSPDVRGEYDGVSEVDTLTGLSMAFLDGFESTGTKEPSGTLNGQMLPAFGADIVRHLGRFLQTYASLMPPRALTHHLKALIAFNLHIYTIKLMRALPDLVDSGGKLPVAMRSDMDQGSPPSVFCDFTLQSSHRSHEMAVASVQRDLAQVDPFIRAVLHLRQLEEHLRDLDGAKPERLVQEVYGEQPDAPALVAAMLRIHAESDYRVDIEAMARTTRRDIIRYTGDGRKSTGAGDDPVNDLDEIESLTGGADSTLDAVVRLLVDAQAAKVNSQISTWFRSVGAMEKPYGMLRGVVGGRGRLQWRYQPTNDLLATLVMVASVDTPAWDDGDPRPQPIRLQDFLAWLERQFGILVDRPPEPFSGAEYQAAAQDNLRAMLGGLRQMGIFRDLSDDFTVQRLIPPYSEIAGPTDNDEESTRW